MLLILVISLGWGAASLHTLAKLMSPETTTEDKLRVWQAMLASVAAGLLVFLGVLHWFSEWGRMSAYLLAFFAAYGGTIVLDAGRDAAMGAIHAVFKSIGTKSGDKK